MNLLQLGFCNWSTHFLRQHRPRTLGHLARVERMCRHMRRWSADPTQKVQTGEVLGASLRRTLRWDAQLHKNSWKGMRAWVKAAKTLKFRFILTGFEIPHAHPPACAMQPSRTQSNLALMLCGVIWLLGFCSTIIYSSECFSKITVWIFTKRQVTFLLFCKFLVHVICEKPCAIKVSERAEDCYLCLYGLFLVSAPKIDNGVIHLRFFFDKVACRISFDTVIWWIIHKSFVNYRLQICKTVFFSCFPKTCSGPKTPLMIIATVSRWLPCCFK